jgi:hypothetical protein
MRKRIPERLCGREFSFKHLQAIKEEVQGGYYFSRAEIARRVCKRLNWSNALGRPQLMSCRVGLLRLERLGLIELPPPQKRNGNGKGLIRQKVELPPLAVLTTELGSLTGLRLDRVRTRKESAYWNSLIHEYHYLGYKPVPGAQVRYLISWDGGDLGAIGFSASAWKVGVRDQWIGWDGLTREKGLRLIVNNSRFLVLPNVRVKNLASRILSLCAGRIRDDFSEAYGYEPVLLETFVEKGRYSGACYRAANWLYLGDTTGRGKLDRNHRQGIPVKAVFVYPLVRDPRRSLVEAGR